ncbi:MAG: hypothetical protein K6F94_02445 [Bacteroidaceae bacterium]|nr:hypothetical protein [Bacteroidaceae bacterium]
MERYESARYYVLSDKKNPERLFEAILDADGRYVILDPDEETEFLPTSDIGVGDMSVANTFRELGYESIDLDEPLTACKINDASVFYFWDAKVESPYGDGHMVTLDLTPEYNSKPISPEELQAVGEHFRKLEQRAKNLALQLDDAPEVKLVHASIQPFYSVTLPGIGLLEEMYIGFDPLDNPILVHGKQIDPIINMSKDDEVENHLLFMLYRLTHPKSKK